MKFAAVKNDVALRKIFSNENKKEVLISFLNAVLDFEEKHKIMDVTILNPYQLPKFRDGKATIIDVKARDQSGREFIVEMQVADALGFSKRVLYYTPEELEAYDYAGLRETEDRLRLAKAKKEEQIKIARQMKQNNISNEIIKKCTDLTDEEIDEI